MDGTGDNGIGDAPPASPEAGGSRTGRNLPAAIGVGAVLAALVIGSVYTVKPLFLVVVMVVVGVGVHELVKAFGSRQIRVPLVLLLAGLAAMLAGAYYGGPVSLVGSFAVTVLVLLGVRTFQGADGFVRDATASVFVAVYPALLAGFVALLLRPDDGAGRVVTFVAITVASDIGGYVAGVLFGRHKMSPIISPKKTWEGFAGSALACVVVGAWLVSWLLGGALWQGAILGAVMVVCATIGDLIESIIKRDLGIKDLGTLLPGHGGAMDRLDSLLFALVPCWLLLSFFVH
ncbi:hypothetical protein Aple_047550 [Acrocarpospora pleiomorpha]|uniref:Phosphatidate cytidylyltransferase n=1 Tax=Acrocarpospora pleiomorpha TaxID=90975 RepID=A0A5M3XU01_9ACTN|nr:phosphatidate cytidylyltransferase [Acrocarpospora pleiomorpha]GES21858.1 hypothetical protein Aple_047550 [Acrocarpospora pleiomorpha]